MSRLAFRLNVWQQYRGRAALALVGLITIVTLSTCDNPSTEPPDRCLVSPDSLEFGFVLIGGSQEQAITLINEGNRTLETSVQLSGSDFLIPSLDSTGAIAVPPGETVRIPVQFRPTGEGVRQGVLDFAPSSCSRVMLRGHGETAVCTAIPDRFDYGHLAVQEQLTRTLTLWNGSAAEIVTRPEVDSPEFSVPEVDSAGMLRIPPGRFLRTQVVFSPYITGPKAATLSFVGDSCPAIPLTGLGEEAVCVAAPNRLSFDPVLVGLSEALPLSITNHGGSELTTTLDFDSPEFRWEGKEPGSELTISSQTTATVVISFSPSGVGERTGVLTFSDTRCSQVILEGMGETGTCVVAPPAVDFGIVALGEAGQRTVLLRNTGQSDLRVAAPESDRAEFTFPGVGMGTGLEVAPGDSLALQVVFTPETVGDIEGRLDFPDGRCGGVELRGRGEVVACVLEPDIVDFATGTYTARPRRTVRIRNTGTIAMEGEVGFCEPFAVVDGAGPFQLQSGESHTIAIEFQPPTSGLFECALDLGVNVCEPLTLRARATRTWVVQKGQGGDTEGIQEAIDRAATGDTIHVNPGRFVENIDYLGKDILLKSLEGPEATVIDGSGKPTSVVAMVSGETRAAVLEGFTVTGGSFSDYQAFGGGVRLLNADGTIRENIITGNNAIDLNGRGFGGGVQCGQSSSLIENNTITNNVAGANGGGIGMSGNYGSPQIIGNTILGNEARNGDGGGISILTGSDGSRVSFNTIDSNLAGDHGGGVYVNGVGFDGDIAIEIESNLVVDNVAFGRPMVRNSGGGIWLRDCEAWVHHNTIVQNSGHGPTPDWGGGIVIEESSVSTIEQNIIAHSLDGAGIHCQAEPLPLFRNNVVWRNLDGHGSGMCSDWWRANGNVEADPQFCGASNGDWRVSSESPAILHPAGPLGAFKEPGCTGGP